MNFPSTSRTAAIITAAAALALPAAESKADQILAQLILNAEGEQIEGTSEHPGREGWIECEAFGQGVSRTSSSADGDTARAEVHTGEYSLIKRYDIASPVIAEHLTRGSVLPEVTIDYLDEDGGGAQNPLRTVLHDVIVTRHHVSIGTLDRVYEGGRPGLPPTEEIGLQPTAIEWVYSSAGNGGIPESVHGSHGDPYGGTSDPLRDDDGDGIPNNLDDDDDNDHLPDNYERFHGMLPFHNDAGIDRDGDGDDAFAEYVGGSDPNDAFSKFRVRSIRHHIGKRAGELHFPVLPGRHYVVHMSVDGNNWFEVDSFSIEPGSDETEAAVEFPMLDASQFFKVEATLQ